MQPVDMPPPLTRWSHVWRFTLVIAIGALAWSPLAEHQWSDNHVWLAVDLSLGVASLALVVVRRRFPLSVALITAVATGLSGTAGGPATLALVSLATRRRWREIVPVSIVTVAGGFALNAFNPSSHDPTLVTGPIIMAATGVTIGWGMYIGSRRELLATLRERADIAEAEQAMRVGQARAAERGRIAREMHDVLAHRISMVTMHAGALTFRQDLTDEEIRSTAAIIQENSHQALIELREVLGVLRDGPGDAAPERPQPAAGDLPELIEDARRSGMRVETDRDIPLGDIPDTLGRTLYRVVQEGLTNARKHSPDTLVTVNLDGGPRVGLTVEVRNPLRVGSGTGVPKAPESGLGLIGLSERAALAGGEMTHRVTPGREFVLVTWLPWPA